MNPNCKKRTSRRGGGNYKYALALAALLGAAGARGDVWYVDAARGDESWNGKAAVWNGTDGPKRIIQSAVAAAAAGDTVTVAPGVYGDDQGAVARDATHAACRVYITRAITLKASGTKADTHIVGKWQPGAEDGRGVDAVSGIVVAADACAGTKIQGFTIRDCADSRKSDNKNANGAAVCSLAATSKMADMPWVVDCTVSNIYASCAAFCRVNLARVRADKCDSASHPVFMEYCNAVYSAFVNPGHWSTNNAHLVRGERAEDETGNRIVNCLLLCNGHLGNVTSTTAPYGLHNTVCLGVGLFNRDLQGCVLSPARGNIGSPDRPVDVTCTNAAATSVFSVSDKVVMDVLSGDYRPMVADGTVLTADSPALNLGLASLLEWVPVEYRWTDLNGGRVTPVNGKIHAGPVQTTAEPVAGFKFVNNRAYGASVNGSRVMRRLDVSIYTDVWPVLYELQGPTKEFLARTHLEKVENPFVAFHVKNGSAASRWLFPDSNERLPFVPEKGYFMELNAYPASHVVYIDAAQENGDPDTGDGTAERPYARFKKAIASVPDNNNTYCVFYVAPGTYDKEWVARPSPTPNCRIHFNTFATSRFIATGEVIVPGAADPEAPEDWHGCSSTNGMRCIDVSKATGVAFQGFTLTGGHTCGAEAGVSNGNSYGLGGAVMGVGTDKFWLMECVITNNWAYFGCGAVANGVSVKCVLRDNHMVTSSRGVIGGQNTTRAIVSNCLIDDTMGSAAGCVISSDTGLYVVNCTVVGKTGGGAPLQFNSSKVPPLNCILAQPRTISNESTAALMKGTLFHGYAHKNGPNVEGVNFTTANALFVDEAGKDFRLAADSPAIGLGAAWGEKEIWGGDERLAYSNYYAHIHCDLDGNMPYFVNGRPTAGAWQRPAKAAVTVDVPRADVTCSPAGRVLADFGAPVTVTVTSQARRVDGVAVNGEPVAAGGAWTFTPVFDPAQGGGCYQVSALVNTNWYVAAEGGDAGNTGWDAEHPLDTLEHVMARAAAGDTVVMAPGVYDRGSMIHTKMVYNWGQVPDAAIKLRSRVVVPAGVTLTSSDGAECTFIKGAFADTATKYGDGAMRAVFLEDGARLKSVTVTGGSTLDGTIPGWQKEVYDNVSGGGILCGEGTHGGATAGDTVTVRTLVEDCVISNNYGRGTSTTMYGSYVRCRFLENHGGSYICREPIWVSDCLFDRNVDYTSTVCHQPYFVDSCTFGAANTKRNGHKGGAYYAWPGSAFWVVRNSVFLGAATDDPPNVRYAFNCRGCLARKTGETTGEVWELCPNEPVTDTEASGAPAAGSALVDAWRDPHAEAVNPCLKYTVLSAWPLDTDIDVNGGQRVYNGVRDIGACERDWRPRYAQVLGSRNLDVTAAAPEVVEADGAVAVPAGELTAAWTGPSNSRATMNVEVTGTGTLRVLQDGEVRATLTAADGLTELAFVKAAAEPSGLSFAYEPGPADTGAALLSRFFSRNRMILVIR